MGQEIYRTPEQSRKKMNDLIESQRRAESCSYLTEEDIKEICNSVEAMISEPESMPVEEV